MMGNYKREEGSEISLNPADRGGNREERLGDLGRKTID